MRIATPAFFCFTFGWNIIFHPFTFSLYVSLGLKWVSYRQHIYGSCFCIHSASLCVLVGVFNPFTFKVIIDIHVPIAIFLIVWGWFCRSFFFSCISSLSVQFSSVQSLRRVRLFATPWIAACQASMSITISGSSLRLTCIESMMPSSHLILGRLLLFLPPIPPSIRASSNESTLRMRWPKHWNFSFSISPSKEHPGLISFRMDWLDLLAVLRDSQESSPTPQFKSVNSSALSFLHSPTFTSIHDHRKNHSLD